MNRADTLAWIEHVLDALDQFEMMEIIKETIAEGNISPEFFETLDEETDRYKVEGNQDRYDRLHDVARTVAAIRQNRKENL